MKCRECGDDNVLVQIVQTGGKNSHKGTGLVGKTNNAARATTAVLTLGMSNAVWKKSKGTTKQKFKNEKLAICQDCGASWKVK